ncbi:PEGA domain-containing protein [candidate division KSB1 bacterium]|nr:PEGA domain-containing protein [candidate division KSB1 bacterium]
MLKQVLLNFGIALAIIVNISSILYGQEKKTLAVLDLDAIGVSETEVRALTERLRSGLIGTRRFTVLERGKMDEILTEMGFQQKGCTSSECIVQAGEILGVQLMVGGSISKVGNLYSIDLRLIDVETSAILGESTEDIEGGIEDVMKTGIRKAAIDLVGGEPVPPPTTRFGEPPTKKLAYGALEITTTPSGARIFLDAQEQGLSPQTLKTTTGRHNLTITKKGYATINEVVLVNKDETNKIKRFLSLQTGFIDVKTSPTGALIYLDGNYMGQAPKKLEAVQVGKHRLKGVKENYTESEKEVEVYYEQTTRVSLTLEGLPGKLLVTSVPEGADVYVDGVKKGQTVLSTSVPVGRHTIRVNLSGYPSEEKQIEMLPNDSKILDFTLKKSEKVGQINAYPKPKELGLVRPTYWGSTALLKDESEIPEHFAYVDGTISGLLVNGFCGLFPIMAPFPSEGISIGEQSPVYKIVWGIQLVSALYMDYALFDKNPQGVWNSWGFSIAVGAIGDIIAYIHDKNLNSK